MYIMIGTRAYNFLDIRDKSNHLIITTYGERIFASIYCGGVPKTILFLDYKSKWEEEAVFWSTVVLPYHLMSVKDSHQILRIHPVVVGRHWLVATLS